jgi:UDP-N-acetyl-2-amino-2-deoxyglucuronate dehydrogenase
VCDPDPHALEAAIRTTGTTGTTGGRTLSKMLASVPADCVVPCTPSGLHPQQPMQAARAGLDIVTEKPMATRWS